MTIHGKLALLGAAAAALSGCVVTEDATPSVTTTRVYEPGYVTTSLPTGYTVRQYNGVDYYVVDDVYYRRSPRGYTVVESPMAPAPTLSAYRPGYEVGELPMGYATRTYRGVDYYVSNNVWYRPHRGGYVVVNPPL